MGRADTGSSGGMGHAASLNLSPGDDALISHLGRREEVHALARDEQGSPSVLQARFGQRHRWHEVPGHSHAVCGRRMGDNSQGQIRMTALLGARQERQRIPALLIWLATPAPQPQLTSLLLHSPAVLPYGGPACPRAIHPPLPVKCHGHSCTGQGSAGRQAGMCVQRKAAIAKIGSHDHQGGRQDPGPVSAGHTRADGLVEGQ